MQRLYSLSILIKYVIYMILIFTYQMTCFLTY